MRGKFWLLAAALVSLAVTGVALGAVKSHHRAIRPSTVFCENVTIDASADTQQSPYAPYAGVGEVLTADTDGTSCFPYNISTYQWERNGVNISGATSQTYTVQAPDTGDTITVKVTDTHGDSQVSPTGVTAVGASKLVDDFNGAANSEPSSTLWNFDSGTSGGITYSGDGTYMGETGSGSLEIQAINNSGTWNSSALTAKSTYSGARYIEMRAEPVCYSGSIADFGAYDNSAGTPNANLEVDLNEQYTTTANYDLHQANVHYWDASNGYHTYHAQTDGYGHNERTVLCGSWHTYGELLTASSIKFYFDGALEFTVNKSDCAFADPDGNPPNENNTPNDVGGDGDCGTDPAAISDFTTFTQTFHLGIIGFQLSSCPSDPDGPDSDPDDSCDTSPLGGSGPLGYFIDYVHVYSQS